MFPLCVIQEECAEDVIDKEGMILAGSLAVGAKVDLTQLRHNASFSWEMKQQVDLSWNS